MGILSERTVSWLSSVSEAMRYWWLRRWVAAVSVAILALSMTSGLAVYAVLNGVWLQAVPYERSTSLISLSRFNDHMGHATVSWRDFDAWRQQTNVFEQVGAFHSGPLFVRRGSDEERVSAIWASPTLFVVLGEQAQIGRLPAGDELHVAVMTASGARNRLSGVGVGDSIFANGRTVTIVGVLPSRFEELAPGDIVLPLQSKSGGVLRVVARLRDGISETAAMAAMEAGLESNRRDHPDAYRGWRARIDPLRDQLVGAKVGELLWLLTSAVILLQLAAAANASMLLMVAAESDRRDTAVRLMLGASVGRLLRDGLVRAGILTALAATVSLMVAFWARDAIVAMIPASVPRLARVGIDHQVVVAAVVLATVTAVLIAYGPIVLATRTSPLQILRASDATGRRSSILTAAVIGQTALACIMAVAAIGVSQAFYKLVTRPLGFTTTNLVTFLVTASGAGSFDWRRHEPVTRALLVDLEQSNEVVQFGASDMPPFSGLRAMYSFRTLDAVGPASQNEVMIEYRLITPNYFGTLGIPIVAGRDLSANDLPGTDPVALINQAAADRFWPGANPVGQRVAVSSSLQPVSIVGVVGNVRQFGFDQEPVPELYRAWLQDPRAALHVIVRPAGSPSELLRRLNSANVPFGRGAAFSKIRMFDHYLSRSVAQQRFRTQLLLAFAATAMLLCATGIIAVTAAQMRRSRQEIALRLALGASRGWIIRRFVFGQALMPSMIGVTLGVGLSGWLKGSLTAFVPEATDVGALPFLVATVALVGSAGMAALLVVAAYTKRLPASFLRSD